MDRPNILMVMTDQQKATSLPFYGHELVRTPALDRLARGGVVVDNAVCNYPACTPARAAVHTGRYPHTTRVRANHIHLSEHEISLPQVLRGAGYTTALIGKNHVFADGRATTQFRVGGMALADWPTATLDLIRAHEQIAAQNQLSDQRDLFDTWFGANHFGPDGDEYNDVRTFHLQRHLWRNAAGSGVSPFPVERSTSGVLAARSTEFLRAPERHERPWFLWLSFPDPHNPYVAPEPFASMYDPQQVSLPPVDDLSGKPERQRIASRMCGMHAPDEQALRRAIAVEYGMISGVDAAVGQVLDALEETGQLQSTIVLFLSDHGGYLGDHGAWHKAPAFYDSLVRIPLVLSWPGTVSPGRLSEGFVEQVDIMPTLLSLVDLPCPPGVQGVDAAPALTGSAPARAMAFSEVGEAGDPVEWSDLPFLPESPLDDRWFPWDGFQEAWVGQGKMVRTPTLKYAWYANGDEELYDLVSDPDELLNLAADPRLAERKQELRDEILRWTVATEDRLPLHAGNIYLEDAASGRLPF